MISFDSLASSSEGCAYRLSADGMAPLLIECGLPFKKLQVALDFRVSEIAGCLISHEHADHSRAWRDLSQRGTHVYASSETWAAMDPGETLMLGHHAVLDPRRRYYISSWTVTPFEAVHDCPGTLGFVIEGAGARCLYLSDSAYCKYRFEGLTHIFIECNHSTEIARRKARRGDRPPEAYERTVKNHMSLERLVEMLKANDLSEVREIHLLHLSDGNSDERAFKEAVQKATGVPVHVAPKVTL